MKRLPRHKLDRRRFPKRPRAKSLDLVYHRLSSGQRQPKVGRIGNGVDVADRRLDMPQRCISAVPASTRAASVVRSVIDAPFRQG